LTGKATLKLVNFGRFFTLLRIFVITEAIAYANRLALESNQAKNSIE